MLTKKMISSTWKHLKEAVVPLNKQALCLQDSIKRAFDSELFPFLTAKLLASPNVCELKRGRKEEEVIFTSQLLLLRLFMRWKRRLKSSNKGRKDLLAVFLKSNRAARLQKFTTRLIEIILFAYHFVQASF